MKYRLDYSIHMIEVWATQRNLHQASPMNQAVKLMEEVGELASGLNKNNPEVTKDSIGDIFVVLTIMCLQLGVELDECIADAYEQIKDRKGKLVNGVFVKESDL